MTNNKNRQLFLFGLSEPVVTPSKPAHTKRKRSKRRPVAGDRGQRPGSFCPAMRSPEQDASIVRGVMMARADDILGAKMDEYCDEFGVHKSTILKLYGDLLYAFFPEEFAEPDEPIERPGIIPTKCPGVGENRLRSFAKLCELAAGQRGSSLSA